MINLTLKFLAATVVGASGAAGGWAIYNETRPITVEDKFNKDGFTNLKEDHEYKAIFYDQKEKIKTIDEIKGVNSVNDFTKIKEWCENQRKIKISDKEADPNFASLCTSIGITSVKGYITQHFDSTKWIDEEEDKDKLYKIILVIYKHNDEFLSWINKDQNDQISSESAVDKFSVLRDKCSQGLSLNYKAVGDDIKYYKWWCQPLPYKTVKDKLKHGSSNWKLTSDWTKTSKLWNKTEAIRKEIKPNDNGNHPNDSEYEKWCKDKENLSLEQDNTYPKIYVIVKSVCSEH